MSSILTNNSSMAALETLRSINRNLETVQAQISSGKKVASAKDNAAVWAVASTMTSDVASFKTITESLSLASATVGVARSVSEKIVSTLQDVKSLIVQAQDPSVDHAKYQTDITAKIALVQSYVDSAQFNGLNLINGTQTANIEVLSSLSRSGSTVTPGTIDVVPVDLNTTAGGGLDATGTTLDVTVAANRTTSLTNIETMLTTAIDTAASFGSVQNQIESQNEFIKTLVDAMNSGIGALTDTDMEAASSRLQALQVQQQLGVQSLAIANQAPQALLALFR